MTEKDLSNQGFVFPRRSKNDKSIYIELSQIPKAEVPPGKNMYFDNDLVEQLLYKYVENACTNVKLRDEIMSHASELIRQIIRANNLQQIYPGKDEASFGDLFQVAWCQVESVLYKYGAQPHCLECYNYLRPQDSLLSGEMELYENLLRRIKYCPHCKAKLSRTNVYYRGKSKVFNMWSQVARTVALAHIKRESRDRKNYGGYQSHLERSFRPHDFAFNRLLDEMREAFKYNDEYLSITDAIERLYEKDDKPHEGFIAKLVEESAKSRVQITSFLKIMRIRSFEFSDAPGEEKSEFRDGSKSSGHDFEDE